VSKTYPMLRRSDNMTSAVDRLARTVRPQCSWQDRGKCGVKGIGPLILPALVVLLMMSFSTGCFAVKLAKGENGTDVTGIQPGVTRANAEAILGPPVREWTSSTGIRYTTYYYDAGRPPNMPDAAAAGILDLITVGIFEFVVAINAKPWILDHHTDVVVISYDNRDVVLGIFDEFDELPPDGRSGPRRWERGPANREVRTL
jgi:hypothetical protein